MIPAGGIDFDALRKVLLLVLGDVRLARSSLCCRGYILNGVVQRTMPPAVRGRGQAQPAAAEVLRRRSPAASCSAG